MPKHSTALFLIIALTTHTHLSGSISQKINYFYKLITYGIQDLKTSIKQLPQALDTFLMPNNPHEHDIALVRHTQQDTLCHQELQFLNARKPYVQQGLQKLLGRTVPEGETPRIALCFSGGGFRSMLMTLGFLEAAQTLGLLDASSYIATLSGSTWAVAPWIASQKTLPEFKNSLTGELNEGLTSINDPQQLSFLFKNVIGKIRNDQCISSMDIYGALLMNTLMHKKASTNLGTTLTESHRACMQTAQTPLPIYTAIHAGRGGSSYEWMEITPFEVGSTFLKAYVPTWAYGRKFNNGISIDHNPEQTLGYYLGIFGSAFAVNFEDLLRLTIINIATIKKTLPEQYTPLVNKIVNTILYSPLNDFRLFPSLLHNFTHNEDYSPLKHEETLCLVDAGIDFGIPIPPLLRTERNVDIIIMYDASAFIEGSIELRKLVEYAQRKNIPLPAIDFTDVDKKTVSVFEDPGNPKAPTVVYFPRIKNCAFSESFDPTECTKNDYCHTFNFVYTQEQIDNLHGLAHFTLLQHADTVETVINNSITKKIASLQNRNA